MGRRTPNDFCFISSWIRQLQIKRLSKETTTFRFCLPLSEQRLYQTVTCSCPTVASLLLCVGGDERRIRYRYCRSSWFCARRLNLVCRFVDHSARANESAAACE